MYSYLCMRLGQIQQRLNLTKLPLNFMSPGKKKWNIIIFSASRKALLGNLGNGIVVKFSAKHDWEVMIKLTIGVLKLFWQRTYKIRGKIKEKCKHGWIFKSTFPFSIFVKVKWDLLYYIILKVDINIYRWHNIMSSA